MPKRDKAAAKQVTKTFSVTAEDLKLMQEIKTKLEISMGTVTDTTIVRMGLRKLAEAEGLR